MRLLPRRTVRLRLAAMYGVLFFVCGALLLALADGVTVSRSSSVEAVRSAGIAGGPTPVTHPYGQPPPSTTDPGLPHQLFIAALIVGFCYMLWRESRNPGSLARGATMLVGRVSDAEGDVDWGSTDGPDTPGGPGSAGAAPAGA